MGTFICLITSTLQSTCTRTHTRTDCTPQETLLHFAARHSLTFFAHHLLTLPGADIAAVLPNEEGHTPLHLSQESGSQGLSQLLTL